MTAKHLEKVAGQIHGHEDPIKHVVVLILENHSFDQMLGSLKKVYPDLEGIDPHKLGENRDYAGKVFRQAETTDRHMEGLDPRHEVEHVRSQLSEQNSGFVKDLEDSYKGQGVTDKAKQFVMSYYPVDFLPALHKLAHNFTICDHWYSSLPGPTWPNRFFALTGTSSGRVNMPDDGTHKADLAGYLQQTQATIFDRLNERGIHWKVYFHDIPQTTVLCNQRHPENAARYFSIDQFFADTRDAEEEFPQFCLIEPGYMGWEENDAHPPLDVMRGEKLIADVYNSIRANQALWDSTLFVVFYDEHGGFYDHVEPPPAIPPDNHQEEYTFDRLGVRVPALLVSPWTEKRIEHRQFDHTSLLKYLIDKWKLGDLGQRTAHAESIGDAITLKIKRTDTLSHIELTPDQLQPPDPDTEEVALEHFNSHQTALKQLSFYLKSELFIGAPIAYSWIARGLEGLKFGLEWLINKLSHEPSGVRVSLSRPDRLSHHNAADSIDNFSRFLARRKKQAVSSLGMKIRKLSPGHERDHALRTLSLISGRKYHREKKGAEKAKLWLDKRKV